MTLFLASVRDAAEAEIALAGGADIIDLKHPETGALGALAPAAIADCIGQVAGRAPVSATIGDLPLDVTATLREAVLGTAKLGVDYVKIGIFPGAGAERCLRALAPEAAALRLILVLFADAMPNFDAIELAARMGAQGVMFDTLGKTAGTLPDHISYIALAGHIASAKAEGLIVGVAGSLRARHVPGLLALEPDLIGFRGALCLSGDRTQSLDPARLSTIRALIPKSPRRLRQANFPDHAPQALC
jgi:dihydroneopterin aldolase